MTKILAHRLDGDGPPLLLLNGGAMSIAAWDAIAAALVSRLRVIRCDLRGQLLSPFPASAPEGERYAIEDHAADVVALLDHLEIARVHVAGTSFGGEVGLVLAADHPQRVESLCVITATDRLTPKMRAAAKALESIARAAAAGDDGGAFFTKLAPGAFSERWIAEQPADFIEKRARQIGMLPPAFFSGIASIMVALRGLDLGSRLSRINAPTLIVGAGLDRTFPPEHSLALAAAIPGARLEMLDDCGHAAVVEAPARIAELVLEFVGPRPADPPPHA